MTQAKPLCCDPDAGRLPMAPGAREPSQQAVSALRASPPSAITLITLRDIIRGVPSSWRNAYANGYYATDTGKQAILRGLDRLDVETCTADDVAEIIGNRSWTENRCDVCDRPECEVIARLGDEPDYEARWQDVCLTCLSELGAWAAQAIEARSGETRARLEPKDESAVRQDAPEHSVAHPIAPGVTGEGWQ